MSKHFADPVLLIAQIVCVEACRYAFVCILLFSLTRWVLADNQFVLHQVLNDAAVHTASAMGWCTVLSWLLASVLLAYALELFVERSKLVLDFALTSLATQLLASTIYMRAPPTNWKFYALHGTACLVTTLLGRRRCRARELRALPRKPLHSERH